VRIGAWWVVFRPVHVVGRWWAAWGRLNGTDWLQRVYLPEREAMQWYDCYGQ
jgi:hypothetical protein